jgi:hypothetical protein|tara:strand:+ start:627 stop:1199 length:573 start_codon:yes stop_codon:yes gene_type:complete
LGRGGHRISDEAIAISDRIIGEVPQDQIYYGQGVRRPIGAQLRFRDTAEEIVFLNEAAELYNSNQPTGGDNERPTVLLAHGTDSSSQFCQILLDGKLKHLIGRESYGQLGSPATVDEGGYYSCDWGLFVGTVQTVRSTRVKSDHREVPLHDLDAILFTTPIVEIVRRHFPRYGSVIKGYRQFGNELKARL